ncbi:hypothetical protein [Micromonospora sp. DT47]|uniref:hypothetical protein n=1 Tax=Micromonospora sp. DT47 TaxID=3393431 RepID=UPI003CED700A
MAKHRRPPADDLPTADHLPNARDLPAIDGLPSGEEAVDAAAYWSVDDCRWPAVRPSLPDHMVDLLAPPIVVGVARVPVTSRATPPGARPGRPLPPAGAASARRPAPGPAGQHRPTREPAERG